MFRFHHIDSFDVLEELRTGHHNPSPKPPMKLWSTLLWLFVIGWALLAFTSCTLTISPDGAKSFSIDAKAAVEILNQK